MRLCAPVTFPAILAAAALTLGLATPAFAGPREKACASEYAALAKPATPYGDLKESFLRKHNTHYSTEAPHPSPIKNQCDLGTCSMHAWASVLEDSYHARTGKPLHVSTRYWAWYLWRKRTLEAVDQLQAVDLKAMRNPLKGVDFDDALKPSLGTDTFEARNLIREAGAIPDSVLPISEDFQKDPAASQINGALSNILARAKIELSRSPKPEQQRKVRDLARERVRALFDGMIGKVPGKFVYEGKSYTPRTFAQERFPELNERLIRMQVKRTREWIHPIPKGKDFVTYNTVDDVSTVARQLLERGKTPYISVEYDSDYIDSGSGIMSLKAVSSPSGGKPLTLNERVALGLLKGSHALQLVGVDVDPATGKVIKWKVRNSHGEDSGDHGYYHMYDDYFRKFILGLIYETKDAPEVPSEAAYLDKLEAREARERAKSAGK